MNEEKLTRRERERLARRNDILAAARKIFAAKGYDRATLDEIAREAEFAKGTLYGYFDNKLDLFISLIKEEFDEATKRLMEVIKASSGFDNGLKAVIAEELEYLKEKEEFFSSMVAYRSADPDQSREIHAAIINQMKGMIMEVAALFQDGVDQGAIKPIAPGLLSMFLISRVHDFYIVAKQEDNPLQVEDGVELLYDITMNGIKAGNK
jgi:AcrR family transcriptional regulator